VIDSILETSTGNGFRLSLHRDFEMIEKMIKLTKLNIRNCLTRLEIELGFYKSVMSL